MIILGVILIAAGLIWHAKLALLITVGAIILAVGLILVILGAVGHPVYGRRHYW